MEIDILVVHTHVYASTHREIFTQDVLYTRWDIKLYINQNQRIQYKLSIDKTSLHNIMFLIQKL